VADGKSHMCIIAIGITVVDIALKIKVKDQQAIIY
jgi:hypothetical protein